MSTNARQTEIAHDRSPGRWVDSGTGPDVAARREEVGDDAANSERRELGTRNAGAVTSSSTAATWDQCGVVSCQRQQFNRRERWVSAVNGNGVDKIYMCIVSCLCRVHMHMHMHAPQCCYTTVDTLSVTIVGR